MRAIRTVFLYTHTHTHLSGEEVLTLHGGLEVAAGKSRQGQTRLHFVVRLDTKLLQYSPAPLQGEAGVQHLP